MNTHQWLDELQEYLFPAKIERLSKISRRRRRFGWSESLEHRTLLAAPVSVNDNYNATSGQTLFVPASGVLANDSDADGDPLSAQLVTPPMIGTLTFNTNGSFSYAAPTGFMGNASFAYRAYDGTSYSSQSTVTLSVSMGGGGGNQAPVARADALFVERNSSSTRLRVLWNDTDPEATALSITQVGMPAHGSASVQTDPADFKNVVAFTPTTGYMGSDSFSYTISDGSATASTTLSLDIHAADNTIGTARALALQNGVRLSTGGFIGDGTPSAGDVDLFSVTMTAGQILKVDVDAAAIDGGGSYGQLNSLLRLFSSSGTQVAINDNGTDPDTNASGNDSYFTYTAATSGTYYIGVSAVGNANYSPTTGSGGSNGTTGSYQLKVLRETPNFAPSALNDNASTNRDSEVLVPVLANDSDANGDVITISQVGVPLRGTAAIRTVSGVSQIAYLPNAGYSGTDSFTYTISDPSGATGTATVFVNVIANAPPSIQLQNPVTVLTESADTSSGIIVATIQITDDGLGTNSLSLSGPGAAAFVISNNKLRIRSGYVLDHETQPQLSVTVTVTDASLGAAGVSSASLTISVTDVNEPPNISLLNQVSFLYDDIGTALRTFIGDIVVVDDSGNAATIGLTGADAAAFEILNNKLYLKAGQVLNAAAKPSFSATLTIDDPSLGSGPDGFVNFELAIRDANLTEGLPVFLVNSSADSLSFNLNDDAVTFREALERSRLAGPGRSVIRFSEIIGSTVWLSAASPFPVAGDVRIEGSQDRRIRIQFDPLNNSNIRMFNITSGAKVTMQDVDLVGRRTLRAGGGIHNAGRLTLNRSSVSEGSSVNGGGVFNSNAAELRVHYSTIFNNQAISSGGGIFAEVGSSVSMLNSTISGNSAQTGGGAWNAGAFQTLSLTLANNSGFTGAGLATTSGAPIVLSNSLVAGNIGSSDLNGQFTSLGHNFVGNAGSVTSTFVSSDRVGSPGNIIDPRLSPLADFGGATWTHALLSGSPAIDAGGNVGIQTIDQRGAQRVLDGAELADPLNSQSTIDIGAFEFGTFFVNATIDAPDVTPAGDGLADTDYGTEGFQVSLRAAVQELNRLAGWNGSFDTQKVLMEGVIRFRPGMGQHWMTHMGAGEDQAGFGDLDIYGNVAVLGNGPQTHVDGGWGPTTPTGMDFRDRIFHVHPGSRLRLERMSIRGGHVIPDSTVVSDRGGAIYNDGGTLEIVDSLFGESPLTRGGSQAKQGGFLYTRNGNVQIFNTAINAHRAEWGGAIYQESGNVSLNNSVLFANGSAFSGGGIYVVSGSLTVTDGSQLRLNFSGGVGHGQGSPSNTGIADGGAIFVAPAGLVTINGESALTGNLRISGQAQGGLALYNQGKVLIDHGHVDANGVWETLVPAIYNESELTIIDSTIDRNNSGAIVNAGGKLVLERTSLSDNQANYWGIGITNDNGSVTIRDSRFVNNFTPMFAPTILNRDLDANLSITGSRFEGNTSEHAGGAVWNENGTVRIQTSTFLENKHWNDGGPGSGGAIHHTSRHVSLGSTPQRFLQLAAAVNNSQSVILLEDVSAIQNLPLPLGLMIGSERMQVTEVNEYFGSIRVVRNAATAESHRVSERVTTYISEQQEHLTLGDPGALRRYQLPLDVVVGLEVMTVTALQGNLATVIRGRRGTRALPHDDPSEVWGVSGSLEVSTSTFSSNRMQVMGFNDFDAGGAVSSIIRPFVTPTTIESSTFIGNEAIVGTAIMTDMEEIRLLEPDEPEPPAYERLQYWIVRKNESWPEEIYQLPTTSMVVQNSVFSENQTPVPFELRLPPIAGGHESQYPSMSMGPYTILPVDSLVSGGGNFVDADAYRYTLLNSELNATATSFVVAQPSKEFPAAPFVMRISQPLDTHYVYEDILVTAWTLNAEAMQVALTVQRGHNATTPRVFPAATKVRISDSGFWAPGDRIGTLDTEEGTIRTSLVATPSGISATATQLEVADTSKFPRVPFEIHVSHDVENPLPTGRDVYYEKMIVTAYAGNTITVERGADWTEAIAHPHGARIEIDTTLYDRLDPGLIGLFGDEAEPRLPMPMQAGSLVDSGRTDRFGNASAEIATNLAGTWGTKTPVYMAVNQNAVVTLSSTLYGDEISATLDNVASLPTVPFLLRLNDEVMTVTQVDAPTRRLTLQRAVARTERDQHDAGTVGVVGVSVTTTSDRLNVKDASIFPPAPFILQVGNERLRVNAVDTSLDILTVVRGQSGSSPVAHSPGTIATHGSLVQVIGAAALPAAPFPAWMGSEFVRVRNVDVTHGIITLERGADRDQPELHTGPNSLVFSTNGLYAGFNGSKTVADQQLSNRVVDSDGDTQYEIDRGATEAIIFRVNTEQDLAEQSPGNGRIDTASGLVSLRAAIAESNANIGESLILLPAGTFVIPEMPVNHRITIRGMGHASTILRSSTGRVFRVESTGHLELRNLAVNAGNVGGSGGAILVAGGQLTTHYTVISGSTAARGGGIANDGGRIVLWNSTLHGNTAEFNGGAIWNSGGGFAELNNVTISGNSAQSGGGVSSTLDSQLTLRNATVTLNQAIESAGGILSLGKIQLGNSIIANNSASSDRDVSGFAASLGGNLIGVIPTSAEVIASPIDLYSSTLIVGETQLLPPTPFEVRVGGVETMTVVAVNGSQWTVERSSDSANRSTHPAGTPVRLDGIWKAQDQIGVSSNPLNPGLGSLTFDAGLVPVHRLLNGSPALNAGLESVFSGVPLESTRRVKFMDRRISVSQTDSLPMVPFQIRANGETMIVVGIDNNVLETVRPQPFPHPIGTMFTVLADARGGLRSYTSIDRGAYEHLPILTISSTQSQVLETNTGTTVNFEFTIVRDGDTSQATDVEYIVLGSSDTSAEPDDFSGLKFRRQMVTFLPGETIKTISLPILGDNIVETHEEFAVELWNETAGTIVTQRRVQATILDNDSSVVTVTHTPSAEGTPATFNVVLSNPVEDGIQISWTTADGTAIAGQDYLAAQGSTSTNGLAPARFVVRTVSDLIAERNETFQVSLIGAAPAAVASRVSFATTSITGTIQNDDFVTVRAVNLTRREGNSGQTAFTFDVVTGSTPLDVPFSITVTPTGSTATAGLDFVATPVVRPFLGVARETVSFTVNGIGDQSPEPDEQFLLNLSASASGRENAFQFFNGTATILNDDSPRIFVSDVARIENNTGQLTAVFDVTLTNPMGQPVSVTVATQNGTAIAGQDFVSTSQTLAFTGMGTQTLSFSVPIIGDSALERDETFNVVLSNLQAGMMGASYYSLRNGTGTILNDDAASLSFVLPAGASWVDSGDPRTIAILLAPRGDLQLSLQLSGQVDSSFQTTVTFMPEDDAQTDFPGLVRTKSFNGTNGELQRFPLRMSGWDFPERVIAKVSVTGLDGRVVTLPNDLVVRVANQRNAQEMRQLGLAEETDECESTDDQVDVSDWRNEGTPGNVPIPVLIRLVPYQGPDGLAYAHYLDPDGNVIPGPGIHNGIYYNTFTPDLSNAVEGDVGFGRDTWGFAIVPIEANGIWYLIGSVDRSNYGTVAMRTGKGDDTNGPMKRHCDEEDEDDEEEEETQPYSQFITEADWTVSVGDEITLTPFETFNYKLLNSGLINILLNDGGNNALLAPDGPIKPDELTITITLPDNSNSVARIGQTITLKFGSVTVNSDLTLTYKPKPASQLKTLTATMQPGAIPPGVLLPEMDAEGRVVRYTGLEEFQAHLTLGDVVKASADAAPAPLVSLSSRDIKLAVSNSQAVFLGDRFHTPDRSGSVPLVLVGGNTASTTGTTGGSWRIDGLNGVANPTNPAPPALSIPSNTFDLDGPVYAGLSTSYRIDLKDLFHDLDSLNDLSIVAIQTPDGYVSNDGQIKLGQIATVDLFGFIQGTPTERFLTIRRISNTVFEITNPLTTSDLNPSGREWQTNGQASDIAISILFTDGQTILPPPPQWSASGGSPKPQFPNLPVYHSLSLRVRPHVSGTSDQWRNSTSAPLHDARPWISEFANHDGSIVNGPLKNATVRITPVTRSATLGDSAKKTVGSALVDMESGTFQLTHDLILDGSGGNSEMALPGLIYDSGTVQPASGPANIVVQALVESSVKIKSATATLNWFDHMDSHNTTGGHLVTSTMSFPVTSNESSFLIAMRPGKAPIISGLYTWELKVNLTDENDNVVVVTTHGQTPVIVNQSTTPADFNFATPTKWDLTSIFGDGWDLAGVPTLMLDYGSKVGPSGSIDDRAILSFPGTTPRLFDFGPVANEPGFTGRLNSMHLGSLGAGNDGFGDPMQFGTLIADGARGEITYDDGFGVEYVFTRLMVSANSTSTSVTPVYVLDRIEPVGVEKNTDPVAFKRKSVFFERDTGTPGSTTYGRLNAIVASDGTRSEFIYTLPGSATELEQVQMIRTIGENGRVREVKLMYQDGRLIEIREVQPTSQDRVRKFSYPASNAFVLSDHWFLGTQLERKTAYSYGQPPGAAFVSDSWLLAGVTLGDNNMRYFVAPAALQGLTNAVLPGASGEQIEIKGRLSIFADLQAYASNLTANPSAGTYTTQYTMGIDGWTTVITEYFNPGADSTGVNTELGTSSVVLSTEAFNLDALGQIKIHTNSRGRKTYFWRDYETPTSRTNLSDSASFDEDVPKYDSDDYRGNVTYVVSDEGLSVTDYETDDERFNALGLGVKSRELANFTANGKVFESINGEQPSAEGRAKRDAGREQEYGGTLTIFNRRKEDGKINTRWTVRGIKDDSADNLAYGSGGPQRPISDVPIGLTDLYEFWEYAGDGLLMAYTDARGLKTSYEYDSKNRIHFVTVDDEGISGSDAADDLRTTTEFNYDQGGFLETRVVRAGGVAGDIMSRTFDVNDPSGFLLSTETQAVTMDALGIPSLQIVSAASFEYASDGLVTYEFDAFGTATENKYNKAGQIVSKIEGLREQYTAAFDGQARLIEQTSTYEYFADGKLKSIQLPGGSTRHYYFDPVARIEWVETTGVAKNYDPISKIHTFASEVIRSTFDSFGRLENKKSLLTGAETVYKYDDNRLDLPTEIVQKINVGAQLPALHSKVENSTEIMRYDSGGNLLFQRKADLAPVTYQWDDLGHLEFQTTLAEVNGTQAGMEYYYITSAAGDVAESYETRVTRGVSNVHLTKNEYDQSGRIRKVMDPLSIESLSVIVGSSAAQDAEGAASPATISTMFESGMTKTITTDRLGAITIQWMNAIGQLVQSQNAFGARERYVYDTNGNLLHQYFLPSAGDTASSRHTEFTYDSLDRLRKTTYHDTATASSKSVVEASASGNIAYSPTVDMTWSITTDYLKTDYADQPGEVGLGNKWNIVTSHNTSTGGVVYTKHRYDSLGNLVVTEEPSAGNTSDDEAIMPSTTTHYDYAYTAQDDFRTLLVTAYSDNARLTGTVYALQRSKTALNTLGQVLEQSAPQFNASPILAGNAWTTEGAKTLYAYDSAGRKTLQVDQEGKGVQYLDFDLVSGRPMTIMAGDITQITDAAKNTFRSLVYDSAGQVVSDTVWLGNTINYNYDALGRVTDETILFKSPASADPATATRTWTYEGTEQTFVNRDGQKTVTVTDPSTGMTDSYWYPVGYQILANGRGDFVARINTTLNSAGQVTSVHKTSNELTRNASTVTFAYDEFGRLVKEVQSGDLDVEGDVGIGLDTLPTTTLARDYSKNGSLAVSQFSVKTGNTFDGIVSLQKYVTDIYGRVITLAQDVKPGVDPGETPAPDPTTNPATVWNAGSVGRDKRVGFIFNPDGTIRKIERFDGLDRTIPGARGLSQYKYNSPDGSLSELTHQRNFTWMLAQYSTQFTTSPDSKLKSVITNLFGNGENNIIDERSSTYTYDEFGQASGGTHVVNGVTSTINTKFESNGNRDSSSHVFAFSNRLTEDALYTYAYNLEGQLIERAPKVSRQLADREDLQQPEGSHYTHDLYHVHREQAPGDHGSFQTIYTPMEPNAGTTLAQTFSVNGGGFYDVWSTYRAIANGSTASYRVDVDYTTVESGTIDFSQAPDALDYDGARWMNLGRVYVPEGSHVVQLIIEKSWENGPWAIAYDASMLTFGSLDRMTWNNQGQLTLLTTEVPLVSSSGGNKRVEFYYDGIGRLMGRSEELSRADGSAIESFSSYANDGQVMALEFNSADRIIRSVLNNPAGGTPLAIDQSTHNGSRTAWYFTDMSGDARTVVAHDGGIQILHREFTDTGSTSRQIGATGNGTVSSVPVFWHGMRLDAVGSFYFASSGLVYDPQTGRSTHDRGGENGYVMFGNAPVSDRLDVDFRKFEGENPSGATWLDSFIFNPIAQLGTGIADGWTAGYVGRFQRYLYGDRIADLNQSGGIYYAGVGFGAVSSMVSGFGAAGVAGRFGQGLRGFHAIMDAVGVAEAGVAYSNGTFGVSDGLSLLPAIGFGARSLSPAIKATGRTAAAIGHGMSAGARSSVRLAGTLTGNSAAAARALSCTGAVAGEGRVTTTIRRLLGECFVAGTPVAIGDGFEPLYAAFGPVTPEEDQWSGMWLVAGVASLAATQVLADERRHKRRWPVTWMNNANGLPVVEPNVPEFNVSDLNFEDVCDELLLGGARR